MLHSLPPELLDLITQHLAAHELFSLFLCGDKTLNHLFVAGGVKYFKFQFLKPNSLVWPSNFFSSFPMLHTIHIDIPSDYYHLQVNDFPFSVLLIEQLRDLRLNFGGSHQFIDFLMQQPPNESFHFHKTLGRCNCLFPCLLNLEIDQIEISTLWHDHRHFPLSKFANHLECLQLPSYRLEYSTSTYSIQPTSSLSEFKPVCIPPQLTRLDAKIRLSPMDISLLPRTLIHLSQLNIVWERSKPRRTDGLVMLVHSIPDDSTSSSTSKSSDTFIDPDLLASWKVARQLWTSSFPSLSSDDPKIRENTKKELSYAVGFPPHLKSLKMICNSSWSSVLLRAALRLPLLESLEFKQLFSQETNENASDQDFTEIPPNLRHLELIYSDLVKLSVPNLLQLLPNQLLSLKLSLSLPIRSEYINLLPRSLECLDCKMIFAGSSHVRGVRVIAPPQSSSNSNSQQLKLLPPNLTKLNVRLSPQSVTPGLLANLPRNLTYFKTNAAFNHSELMWLPKDLKVLECMTYESWTNSAIQSLPRGILKFKTVSPSMFESECIDWPPQLTSLTAPFITLNDLSIQSLPKSLKKLRVSFVGTSESFIKLPRGLIWMDLGTSQSRVCREHLDDLPPNLAQCVHSKNTTQMLWIR